MPHAQVARYALTGAGRCLKWIPFRILASGYMKFAEYGVVQLQRTSRRWMAFPRDHRFRQFVHCVELAVMASQDVLLVVVALHSIPCAQ